VSVLVVAEQREGTLNRATWETIAAAQQIGSPLRILVIGAGVERVAGDVAAAECDGVTLVDDVALEHYTADGYVAALAGVIEREQPSLVFLAHTYQTRDFAPALAARLNRPLVTDVTDIKKEGDRLLFVRPMFQGKLNADVAATGPAPHLVTCQIGSFRADAARRGASAAVVQKVSISIDASSIRQTQ
jgi:electron transfer flavoprotein alpha subunit